MVAARADTVYTHAAEPKSVARKSKYRAAEEEDYGMPANIMFDRRVVRGNTYAAQILPAEPALEEPRPSRKPKKRAPRVVPRTPEAVDGRRHMDIQTDSYLEELVDVIPEADNGTQTDPFMDRPPTPLFVPVKMGVDAVTQIDKGDLFDFEYEVEPILEVLVGKILEQGLMEVMEEEELAAMRAHQEHFEQLRNAELVATQRMEAAEKRKIEEKERRLAQERERMERERIVREKVAAAAFSRGYMSGMMGTIIDRLYDAGHFYDPVEKEVRETFMPWLRKAAGEHLERAGVVSRIMQGIAAHVMEKKADADAGGVAFQEAQQVAVAAHAKKVSDAAAALEQSEKEAADGRASYILNDMLPRVATVEAVEETRQALGVAAEEAATASWEAAKTAAGEEARIAAEGRIAEAAAAAAPEGEEGEVAPAPSADSEASPAVDVEAEVSKAVAGVQKPEVKAVTDNDVLSALIEKGTVSKDAITHAMAVASLGSEGYIQDPAFEGERAGPVE